ncbi:MAG: hypothetical protein PWQ91_1358 [Eubacteriales bacterium]|nr:hypothetical protein [Eubacteriales bacterium]MDN5364296.1 hypothetical protein [Eubacteriales bacterium]
MFFLVDIGVVVITVWTALYTFNFGRIAARDGNRRGAYGLYVLALITLLFPLWLYFFRPVR